MLKRFLTASAVLSFAIGLILFPECTSESAFNALILCGKVIIPSLFPFLVLSSFVIKSALISGFSNPYVNAFILGATGGYPIGAATVCEMYSNSECSKDQAETMLTFCNNCGPAFIFGAVGGVIFKSLKISILLYTIHIMSAILTAIFFKPPKVCKTNKSPVPEVGAFPNSVKSAALSIINICAFVIFFSVLCDMLNYCGVFRFLPPTVETFIIGVLELTSGVCRSPATKGGFVLCATLIGFGGLSVHAQAASFIAKANLSAKKHFYGKVLQSFFSFLLAVIAVIFRII